MTWNPYLLLCCSVLGGSDRQTTSQLCLSQLGHFSSFLVTKEHPASCSSQCMRVEVTVLQVGLNMGSSPHHLGRPHKQQALECGPCTCGECGLFPMCRPVRCFGPHKELAANCGSCWLVASPRALPILSQTCILCSTEGDAGAQAMEGDFDAGRATMRRHVHRKVGSGLHMPPPPDNVTGVNRTAQASLASATCSAQPWGPAHLSAVQAQHGATCWAPHSCLSQLESSPVAEVAGGAA